MPARRRGGGISPIDSASTAASSPREDWLICAQVEVRHSPGYNQILRGNLMSFAERSRRSGPAARARRRRRQFSCLSRPYAFYDEFTTTPTKMPTLAHMPSRSPPGKKRRGPPPPRCREENRPGGRPNDHRGRAELVQEFVAPRSDDAARRNRSGAHAEVVVGAPYQCLCCSLAFRGRGPPRVLDSCRPVRDSTSRVRSSRHRGAGVQIMICSLLLTTSSRTPKHETLKNTNHKYPCVDFAYRATSRRGQRSAKSSCGPGMGEHHAHHFIRV